MIIAPPTVANPGHELDTYPLCSPVDGHVTYSVLSEET